MVVQLSQTAKLKDYTYSVACVVYMQVETFLSKSNITHMHRYKQTQVTVTMHLRGMHSTVHAIHTCSYKIVWKGCCHVNGIWKVFGLLMLYTHMKKSLVYLHKNVHTFG